MLVCSEVRNRYANGSWEAFNELLDKTPPLNGEQYACGLLILKLSFLFGISASELGHLEICQSLENIWGAYGSWA